MPRPDRDDYSARVIAQEDAQAKAEKAAADQEAAGRAALAKLGITNASSTYGTKTVHGRGSDRDVSDPSKFTGFTVDNGNGTYTSYYPDGTKGETHGYDNGGGFLGGLGRALDSIAKDDSGVIGKFVVPAVLMAAGAEFLGPEAGAASSVEPASAGATNLFADAANASGYLPAGETVGAGEVASKAWTLKDINNGLSTARLAADVAKDPLMAIKNYGVNKITGMIDNDYVDLIKNLGGDVKGEVRKAVDTVAGTDKKPDTATPKAQTPGQTPYNISPALLALIASQFGQQQQAPVQPQLADVKSDEEFDPFGKFTAHAAQGGSTSDLIRLLRS